MATQKTTPADDFVTLIVPVGTKRSARIVLPSVVAVWLRDQLAAALKPANTKTKEGAR